MFGLRAMNAIVIRMKTSASAKLMELRNNMVHHSDATKTGRNTP